MEFDPIVLGLAGRGILDRQEAERQRIAQSHDYLMQVQGLLNQGYGLEEAHREVQDFYDNQAALQENLRRQRSAAHTHWGWDFSHFTAWDYIGWAALIIFLLVFLIPAIIMTAVCGGACS